MALDSPIISDQDSLIEQEPLQIDEPITRGSSNYSTFTRKRPGNLPNSLQKKKRASLMSPQSIPNLDSDDVLTPDFAMTQSMYEPLEKRKQQARMEADSKLLNLLASEKSAQAAKERKLKEIKNKAIENKKRNEEKQRLAEERRHQMLVEQEEKKRKILSKINLPSPMTGSCYVNTVRVPKHFKGGSGFAEKCPISSTGKIFGFGSSAPRDVCEKISIRRTKKRDLSIVDIRKPVQPISRMCASQIVSKSNFGGDIKFKKHKEPENKLVMASTTNISNFNKSLIKNKKALGNIKNGNGITRIKISKSSSPEVKSKSKLSPSPTPINEMTKSLHENVNIHSVKKSRERSAEKEKSVSNLAVNSELRSRTLERKPKLSKHIEVDPTRLNHERKSTPKLPEKKPKEKSNITTLIKHQKTTKIEISKSSLVIPKSGEHDNGKKSEVRFEEKENTTDDDHNLLSQSSIGTERRAVSNHNLTEEEYKKKLALQRRLAKEKRKREQEELEEKRLEEIRIQNMKNEAETANIANIEIFSERTEIDINEGKNETVPPTTKAEPSIKEVGEPTIKEAAEPTIKEAADPIIKEADVPSNSTEKPASTSEESQSNDAHDPPSISIETVPTIMLTKTETNTAIEMTKSIETLDRMERKKRLDLIMSRIKKPIGGSSENVAGQIKTSTLQDMMNKGHLSGMSKTAAILMRNAHQTSDLSASATNLHVTPDQSKSPSPNYLNSKSSEQLELFHNTDSSDNIEETRGACDGQEDVIICQSVQEDLSTKSDLMDNLVYNSSSKPYLQSWQEKYSNSYSLDTEDGNTE